MTEVFHPDATLRDGTRWIGMSAIRIGAAA
jgi:hypothetical protein